jgi:hypothetical protein
MRSCRFRRASILPAVIGYHFVRTGLCFPHAKRRHILEYNVPRTVGSSLPVEGARQPVHINIEFDASMVVLMIDRLRMLGAQMKPPPRKKESGTRIPRSRHPILNEEARPHAVRVSVDLQREGVQWRTK